MRKIVTFTFFFLLLFNSRVGAGQITVSYGYGIDIESQLILVNQDITSLNPQINSQVSSILIGDQIFYFTEEVETLEIGKQYIVESEKNGNFKLYFTELPIAHLRTENKIIQADKVLADFQLTESNSKTISSRIGVRIRGGVSALVFPKKNYRIEFWQDEAGDVTKDVSLLDMRMDDDWNLHGMYNEPLRATNMVGFDVWRKINTLYYQSSERGARNGSRWKYSELFLNDRYQGIYGVIEPVDRKQLQLKKYNEKNGIRGELYKGMCTCSYNPTPSVPDYGNPLWEIMFEYKYPNEIPADWDNLMNFRNFIIYAKDLEFYGEIESHFVLESAVDYFIFMNLLRGNDNKGKNLYLARYNANEPYFFVAWDLDAVFGMTWDGSPVDITNDILTNFFYDRLLKDHPDNKFHFEVKKKWKKLRKDWLTTENIIKMFSERYELLLANGVYEREELAWSDFNFDPQENFDYLNSWLSRRISFLDREFDSYALVGIEDIPVDTNEPCDIRIYNVSGQLLKILRHVSYQRELILQDLEKGVYILHVQSAYQNKIEKVVRH